MLLDSPGSWRANLCDGNYAASLRTAAPIEGEGGGGEEGDAARADDDAKKLSWRAVASRGDEALDAVRSVILVPSVPVFAHPFEDDAPFLGGLTTHRMNRDDDDDRVISIL